MISSHVCEMNSLAGEASVLSFSRCLFLFYIFRCIQMTQNQARLSISCNIDTFQATCMKGEYTGETFMTTFAALPPARNFGDFDFDFDDDLTVTGRSWVSLFSCSKTVVCNSLKPVLGKGE